MGYRLNTYLGPYIRVTDRKETRELKYHGCPNDSCGQFIIRQAKPSHHDFCSKCGTRHTTVTQTVPARQDLIAVVGSEALTSVGDEDGLRYLVPNVRRPGDPRPEGTRDEPQHIDLYANNMTREIDWLREAFAPEIEKLQEAFDDVKLSWGFHQYER